MLNENEQIFTALSLSLAVPITIIAARRWRERKAITVTVKITKIEEVFKEEHTSYHPTFEIVAGRHKGIIYRSDWDCGSLGYTVGEYTKAKLFEETGEIFSEKKTHHEWFIWFAPFLMVFSAFIIKKMEYLS